MDVEKSVKLNTKIAQIDTLIRMYSKELEHNQFDKKYEN